MAASGMGFSYREVQLQDFPLRWKEITLSSGGHSVTSDVKLPERAGGYAYQDSSKVDSSCRNRFICWRTNKDVLELMEVSLDVNLSGNCVRFRFQGAPIVPSPSVHESQGSVVILVSTTCSVHRLVFRHPNTLQRFDHKLIQRHDYTVPSIFLDASVVRAQEPTSNHYINTSGQSSNEIHAGSAWLTNEEEALFALGTNSGSIVVAKLPPYGSQGIVTQHELKQSNMIQRFWTGLVPAMMRGGQPAEMTLSLALHPLGADTFIFTLCRDHKLRMWSCKSFECVLVQDMLDYIPEDLEPQTLQVKGEGHLIKAAIGSTSQTLHLGVYLSFSDRSQVCILQPMFAEGRYQMKLIGSVFGPQDDLIDICVTMSHIWSLWTNGEGEHITRYSPIMSDGYEAENWINIKMEESEKIDVERQTNMDPREIFMSMIFFPGRFSVHTILKALNIFRRSLDVTQIPDIPLLALKEEVSSCVGNEIYRGAREYEINEEEYVQLQFEQWSKFYSLCVQYQERGAKPLGIMADNNTGMVSIVKKECVSFLRPYQAVEHLCMMPIGVCMAEDFDGVPILGDDEQLCRDIIVLCDCLKLLGSCLTEQILSDFQRHLYYTEDIVELANTVATEIVVTYSADTDVAMILRSMHENIQKIIDVTGAVEKLIEFLDVSQTELEPRSVLDEHGDVAGRELYMSQLFSSNAAIELLLLSVRQTAKTRLESARTLVILLALMIKVGEQANLNLATVHKLEVDYLDKAAALVWSYYVLLSSAETVASPVSTNIMDGIARQMEALDYGGLFNEYNTQKTVGHNVPLLELFLRGIGGVKMREGLARSSVFDDYPGDVWTQALGPAVMLISQILWPLSSDHTFAKFLICHGQFIYLQDHVRLMDQFAEQNVTSYQFILALCYLNHNEPEKARECFLLAQRGLDVNEFLQQLVEEHDGNPKHAKMLYFIKVIRLFEVLQLPDQVIYLAETANSIATEGNPYVPTLWSIIFKHELGMGHNQKAYTAMISNPDASRRKDCLRQFLVVLCERSELQTLVELPYKERHVDLEDEVVNILESRARSIDLTKHNYYDLLYAFHVFRANYRKAGSVMYEYGMRLGQEVAAGGIQGLRALQRQSKCYLATLNALRLVDSKYAWIVKPVCSTGDDEEVPSLSAKHTLEGDEFELEIPAKRSIEVLELDDIQKEYILVDARLKLLMRDPEHAHMTGPTALPDETIGLLVNSGLFDSAVTICIMFDSLLTPVFEGLASRCVKLAENCAEFMQGDNEYTAEAWQWLQSNDLTPANATRQASSADQAWRLLQSYLEKYGDQPSIYHRPIAEKLLSQGFPLPDWFLASYKKKNAPELLRLYLDYDELEEAAHLTLEYIDAVMGKGNEYFGMKTYLYCGAPSVWLPYTAIDQLLIALKDVKTEPLYTQLYQQLNERLKTYYSTLEKVSHDTIAMALKKAAQE